MTDREIHLYSCPYCEGEMTVEEVVFERGMAAACFLCGRYWGTGDYKTGNEPEGYDD